MLNFAVNVLIYLAVSRARLFGYCFLSFFFSFFNVIKPPNISQCSNNTWIFYCKETENQKWWYALIIGSIYSSICKCIYKTFFLNVVLFFFKPYALYQGSNIFWMFSNIFKWSRLEKLFHFSLPNVWNSYFIFEMTVRSPNISTWNVHLPNRSFL